MTRYTTITVLVLGLLVLPAVAQERGFSERVDVSLVTVETIVNDAAGRPVTDLTADDFRVLVDGQEVAIAQFEPPSAAVASGEDGSGSGAGVVGRGTGRTARRLVVYIDEVHSGAFRRADLLGDLYEVLLEELGPEDEVMVAVYDGSVRIVTPFTSSQKKLLEGLREAGTSPSRLSAGQEDRRIFAVLQESQLIDLNGATSGTASCVGIGDLAWNHARAVFSRTASAIGSMEAFISSLAGVPGEKTLIHVSDGLPLLAGAEAVMYAIELCDGTAARQGIAYAVDVAASGDVQLQRWDPYSARLQMTELDTSSLWRQLTAHANANRVSIYPVRSSGIQGASSMSVERMPFETVQLATNNPKDSLVFMARETGGVATVDTNSFRNSFESMLDDGRQGYLLAFSPREWGTGRRHSIKVKVDRPRVRVRHRRSYQDKNAGQQLTDAIASALVHDIDVNPFGMSLELHDTEGETTRKTATFRLNIPLAELALLPQGAGRRGLCRVFVAARNESGESTGVRETSIPVEVPPEALENGEDFVWDLQIQLSMDTWRIAVAVQDELSGRTSVVSRDIVIR